MGSSMAVGVEHEAEKQTGDKGVEAAESWKLGPHSGVIPWLMAEADESWWEQRRCNPKRLGEISQAQFLLKARTLGFGVAVPWGDSEKYDFVVWEGENGRLLRVQVKSTERLHRRGYEVQPVYSTRNEGKKGYSREQIDVLAAHVRPLDVWYLLPIAVVAGEKSLRFYPDIRSRHPRWEKYREAWDLLRD
ncbi:MAG: group I intron-associated PD-(D/E)XK endonuclease [Candidatus Sulfotelmatobacter sp.]